MGKQEKRRGAKCCAKLCDNSPYNGYQMFCLPSISKEYKRNQWLENAGLSSDDLPKTAKFSEVSNVFIGVLVLLELNLHFGFGVSWSSSLQLQHCKHNLK